MIVFPLALFFTLGYLFKRYFSYHENTGQILTRIILNVTLPATIILSTSNTKNISQSLYLPFIAIIIQLAMFIVFYTLAGKLKLPETTESVFVTVPLISNTLLFLAPFFYLAYGDQGLTRVILYDIGNAIMIYFIAQGIFIFNQHSRFNYAGSVKAVLTSAPLWAFFIGLLLTALDVAIPEFLLKPLGVLKEVNVFFPMFVLGFYFRPTFDRIKFVLFTVFFRMFLGLPLGLAISFLFSNPLDKLTVIMASCAPIGMMSLIFSAEYKKDTFFASSIVSYSMILGLILCSFLDYFFRGLGWL